MASGIRNLQRVDAVDLDGREVAVMIGYTSGGRVVLGIAPAGADKAVFAFLNGDAQAKASGLLRAAVISAAEESS